MKKKSIFALLLLCVQGLNAQINITHPPVVNKNNSNVFLDASVYFSSAAGASNNLGKGLVFPSVDLVNFEFNSTFISSTDSPAFYDGMVVYNNASGTTLTSGNRSSAATAVTPGFYYFSSPNGALNENVTGGTWLPLTANSTSSSQKLIQIGFEADFPNNIPSSITASQLVSISGVNAVIGANEAAYQEYIDANPNLLSSPATIAEVQAMIDAVNALAVTAGTITNINCETVANNGTLANGIIALEGKTIINYTGGNGGTHTGQTVNSTGVTGLTATLATGNFAIGAGSLTYTITGTPSTSGTASFAINIGGQTCTITRTVAPSIIPATITLAQNRMYMIASVYDQDYLPYTTPNAVATTNTQTADGSNEAVTVNLQGAITTTGVSVSIPVTTTGSGTLPAYSTTITIPANMTQDNISRNLTLSWAVQAYTVATSSIKATLKAIGGPLNAEKLDINAGIGNDALGILMGQFNYPYDSVGNITTYSVRDIAGIPDRMFGLADNTNKSTTHQMVYLPLVAEDGKVWLNNNLGAHYANMNHAFYNPAQQARSNADHLAYGSLFQWGRKPDGHELITYTNGNTATAVNGTTTLLADSSTPSHALFIYSFYSDWRSEQDDTLWATEASNNNPCPKGFRVPTITELSTLVTAAGITNQITAASSKLKFSSAGCRTTADGNNGSVTGLGGNTGQYWSNSVTGTEAKFRSFYSSTSSGSFSRSDAMTVRCIQD